MIGVLEYQGSYTNSENPYKDFLKKIKQLLKPNGKLLIAIENQYGLKYWCGAREDHTGTVSYTHLDVYKRQEYAWECSYWLIKVMKYGSVRVWDIYLERLYVLCLKQEMNGFLMLDGMIL